MDLVLSSRSAAWLEVGDKSFISDSEYFSRVCQEFGVRVDLKHWYHQ